MLTDVSPTTEAVFVAEFDGTLGEVPLPLVEGGQVFRYWPGHTRTSMAWLVRNTLMPIVAGFAPKGRALALNLCGAAGSHSPITIVGVHLPVNDDPFPESLTDMAELIARRRRGAIVYVVGDTNTQWPAAGRRSAAPSAACSSSTVAAPGNRAGRHKRRRQQFGEIARAFGLHKMRMTRWTMEHGMCAVVVHSHTGGGEGSCRVSVELGWRVVFWVFRSQCRRCRHRMAVISRGACLPIESDCRPPDAARSAAVAAGVG